MAIAPELIDDYSGTVDLDRDRRLVLRYQQGDQSAFDELYRRYYARLQGYCQRRVGDLHIAEELAQEAFARALLAMPRFAGERRFYPWMTVIAARLCIDHHRRASRTEPVPDVEGGVIEADHDAVFAQVDRDHLEVAVDKLSPRHREVLDLREQRGWSYQTIADHLDVPVTTVEALLHRARRALRREYLAVAGGERWAGLPVLGSGLAALARIRHRLEGHIGDLAHVLAPAAAGVAAVGIASIPLLVPSTPAPVQPPAVVTTQSAAPRLVGIPPEPAAVEPALAPAGATPAQPATTPKPVEATLAPSTPAAEPEAHQLGAASLVVGPEGTAAAQDQAEEMPLYLDAVVMQLGFDPAGSVRDVLEVLNLGGQP
ncbi:MAG: sigma-70 family RNA polymerase sigma factor [Acidimicrobiales bacterium]